MDFHSLRTRFLLLLVVFVSVTLAALVVVRQRQVLETSEKLRVAASFYPLGEFARVIGGERVLVTTIVPTGAESHEYEPTPKDVAAVRSATLFLLQGGGYDPWAERVAADLPAERTRVVNMMASLTILGLTGEQPASSIDGTAIVADPHVWLDPLLAAKEIEGIRDALITVDPAGATVYAANAAAYLRELDALHDAFKAGLTRCAKRTVITAHAAFGYLAKRYGFVQEAIVGLSSEEEPTPRRIAEVIALARRDGIAYILYDPLAGPRLAETVAREIGARTALLDPLEGLNDARAQAGETYLTVMRENLTTLRTALACP